MNKYQAKKILEKAAQSEGVSTKEYAARIMEAMMLARSEADEEASAFWSKLGDAPTPEDLLIFLIESLNELPVN